LSEVLGGLIVALAMIGLAVSLYTITAKVASKAAAVAGEASSRLDEALTPPQMMLRLEDNRSLVLHVYTVRSVDVERVIVSYANGTHRELGGARVDGSWSIVLDPSYGCEHVRIAIVTSRGNVFYYSPLNDPGLEAVSMPPGGYVDCNTLLGGGQGGRARVYQGGSIASLVDAGYSSAVPGASVGLSYEDTVAITGPISGRCWASVYRGGSFIGALYNGKPLVIGEASVGGLSVNVTLLMSCREGYSAIYLVLAYSGGPAMFGGDVYVNYTADTYRRYMPSGGLNDTMLPVAYSPMGSFYGEATLRYKPGSAGNYIEAWGYARGAINTTSTVLLLVNTMNVELWLDALVTVRIERAVPLSLEGSQAPLNLAAPLKVTRECPLILAGDEVTRAVFEGPLRRPSPEIVVSHSLGSAVRELECGETVIVETPAASLVSARFPPPLEAPLLSSMVVESSEWFLESGGW
jgi:hypothetical protein